MRTQCNATSASWAPSGRREVVSSFDGGFVSSDGGLLLLREVAQRSNFFEKVASCFVDHRDPRRIQHTVANLVAQRVLGIACGYEDVNDHDTLRHDPLFVLAVGKTPPATEPSTLAAHATLHRLETAKALDPRRPDLKILHNTEALEAFFVDFYLDSHAEPPKRIVLDIDATDDPIHGNQEGRYFHGYYGNYCYLPLYIFAGEHLLVSKLRTSDKDGAYGALEELKRVIDRIRQRWPEVKITVRGDSGFCRDALLSWCEDENVTYVTGLARNARLESQISEPMQKVVKKARRKGRKVRVYRELRYKTQHTWSQERRVVAKVEALVGKSNPRFVVTNLSKKWRAKEIYEELYCARGEMENRIKEQQLGLFADRTSSHSFRANQLRLWFSSLAYLLFHQLRRIGLRKTVLARAQVSTIRARLLKVGAIYSQSVRRVKVSLSSAFPLQAVWEQARSRLARAVEACGM